MNARSLARLLVAVALACAGLVLVAQAASAQGRGGEEGAVVQNGNHSTDSEATSAPVEAGNSAVVQSGPAASDGGRAAMVGDTRTSVDQQAKGESGPARAGSQVSNPRRRSVEQNTNRTAGASAESGPVSSFNDLELRNGPFAEGEGAFASQFGDGDLDARQKADGRSGPADSGSQLTDARGVTQNLNECGNAVTDCGEALSGEVEIANTLGEAGDIPAPSGVGPVAVSDGEGAFATLVGDADAVLTQSGEGTSGAATAGSQRTGGDGTVQNDNVASGGEAESGPITVDTFAAAYLGPVSFAGSTMASAHQVGDASGDLDQEVRATTGDATTGSQTTEASSAERGARAVQNRSASEDDTAVTGAADASSEVLATAGPLALGFDEDATATLAGDAAFDVRTDAKLASGDAAAGSQDTDGRATTQNDNTSSGGEAVSGDVSTDDVVEAAAGPAATADAEPASAAQSGAAHVKIRIRSEATSGDALAGSQTDETRGDATVQNGNDSLEDLAASGNAETSNDVSAVAGAVAGEPGVGTVDAPAEAVLSGDARIDLDLRAEAHSGDATTGSQLTEAGGGASSDENLSEANASSSGDALAGNAVDAVAGPFAGLEDVALAADLLLGVEPAQLASEPLNRAVMSGDAGIDADLRAEATSGDAWAGVQFAELRGDGVTSSFNVTDSSEATSSEACADPSCMGEVVDADGFVAEVPGGNTAILRAGPVAGGPGAAEAVLAGDARAGLGQRAVASSGDAVAASQHHQARGGGVVADDNEVTGAVAGCEDCPAVAGNLTAAFVGPLAFADAELSATATQVGDAALRGRGRAQEAKAEVGTALAGVQISDARSGSVIEDHNTAEEPEAAAGPVTSHNSLGADPFEGDDEAALAVAGAAALAFVADARATLAGDASLEVDQKVDGLSADAIAASQLVGLRRRVTVQLSNDSRGDLAESGEAAGLNAGGGVAGPRAEDGDAALAGDAEARFDQRVRLEREDADIAGSQVVGRRTFRFGRGETVRIPREDVVAGDEAQGGEPALPVPALLAGGTEAA